MTIHSKITAANVQAKIDPNSIEGRVADALAGKGFQYDSTQWSKRQWDDAIDYARIDDDTSELEYMLREDRDAEVECNAELRRTGCDYADYAYYNARAAESYVAPIGGAA